MHITYSWLKKYMDLDLEPENLVKQLTDLGLEVEAVQPTLSDFHDVVVGRVVDVASHPDADKLSVCAVSIDDDAIVQIVCGASNVRPGILVPVAVPGAILPFGKISSRKVRGVTSHGMICSEEELGFAEKSDGIWILDDDSYQPGRQFRDFFKADWIFEISVGPNRPDCLGLRGLLRELSLVTNSPSKIPEPNPLTKEQDEINISIRDQEGCPRYVGALIKGITVKESPAWMQAHLRQIGLRSINNIVDITNFLMMEYGHPMHAFDADLIRGSEIIIRGAEEGETLVTLDGINRQLAHGDLLICDGVGPVALGGIMGGENTEIRNQTKNLFIEIAYFDPIRIRKTSRKLKLHTDASHRFERGMDPELPAHLMAIVVQQVIELAGGSLVGMKDVYPSPWKPIEISFDPGLCKRILGIEVPLRKILEILEKIGCQIEEFSESSWTVRPPSFRPDLERPIDLVEEICRIYGMNEIPFEAPFVALEMRQESPQKLINSKIQDLLMGLGLQECITYSFSDNQTPESISIRNPLSDQMGYLRSTIAEKLLGCAIHNLKQQNEKLGLFEIGTCFLAGSSAIEPYIEESRLAIALCNHQETNWKNRMGTSDLFDLKGVLTNIEKTLGVEFRYGPASETLPFLTLESSLQINFRGKPIGVLGDVKSSLLNREKIFHKLVLLELKLDEIYKMRQKPIRFHSIPQIPGAHKQLALITPLNLPCEEVLKTIEKLNIPILETFEVFDLYEGKGIPQDHKSLGLDFFFRGKDKTLSEEEMSAWIDKILSALRDKFSIVLRP